MIFLKSVMEDHAHLPENIRTSSGCMQLIAILALGRVNPGKKCRGRCSIISWHLLNLLPVILVSEGLVRTGVCFGSQNECIINTGIGFPVPVYFFTEVEN